MPTLSVNSSQVRAGGYFSRVYLTYLPRTTIFARAVNQATFTYPITSLTYDNPNAGVGVFTDVKVDQTLLVYNSAGTVLKGLLRVAAGAASATVLQINEVANGGIDFADDDLLLVVAEWNLFDKLVSATAAFNKDSRIIYSAQGSDPPPIANSGGPVCGFVNDSTGLLTVNFVGNTSFRVDPDAGSITHSWSFPGGTPATSTGANPAGVTFPASATPYICSHTVTDSNGTSTTQYVAVFAFNRTTITPLSVEGLALNYRPDSGWTMECDVAAAAAATIPDKSMVIVWEEESYGWTLSNFGSNVAGRSNIKFVGFLWSENVRITPDASYVHFSALSPLAVMDKLGALPQLMINATSPANWQQVKSLTVWRALWYLLYWHSSFNAMFDFLWPGGVDLAYARLAVDNIASIAGQLRDVANAINVDVTCDRLGRMLLVQNPNYLANADRSALTTTFNLTAQDIREIELPRGYWRTVKFVRGDGIVSSSTTATAKPVFSNAPGNAPGEGTQSEQFSRKIIDTQATLNRLTGEHYAYVNSIWYDETTKALVTAPQGVRVTLPDGYDWIDPAYHEWFTLTLSASTNLRALTYGTGERWLAQTVNVAYESGGKTLEVVFDHETHGPAGVTYVPPQKTDTGTPVVTPPGITFPGAGGFTPPTIMPGVWNPGANTIAVITSTGIWTTNNFNTPAVAGGPTWTFTLFPTFGGKTARMFVVDAKSPRYLGTGTTVNGWIRTDQEIYRVTDIFGSLAIAAQVTALTTPSDWGMDFSYGAGGAGLWGISVSAHSAGAASRATYTTDGVNWSALTNISPDSGSATLMGVFISANTGFGYAGAVNPSGTWDMYRIDPVGLSWSSFLGIGATGHIANICVPFFNNRVDTYLYFHKKISGSVTIGNLLMRYDGLTQTDITPVVGGVKYAPNQNGSNNKSRWQMTMPSNADTKMLVIASADSPQKWGIFVTNTLKDATPTWLTVLTPTTTPTYVYGAFADDGQSGYFWGSDNSSQPHAGYSGNLFDGSAIDDRTGNMTNDGTRGLPIGLCGG